MPFRPERPASIPPSSFYTDTAGSARGKDWRRTPWPVSWRLQVT